MSTNAADPIDCCFCEKKDKICFIVGIPVRIEIRDDPHMLFWLALIAVSIKARIESDPLVSTHLAEQAQKISVAASDLDNLFPAQVVALDQG